MDAFYAFYKDFTPDPLASLAANFDALALKRGWAPGGHTRTRAHRHFRDAMIEQFNVTYGTDAGSLENWQNLCRVVGVTPAPESVTQCKKAVRKTHVNLVDLIDVGSRGGAVVVVFASLGELREYTRTTGKYFSKNPAKAGGILKALLRDMGRGGE